MQQASATFAPDSLARAGAIAIAATRIGIGIGALVFTRPALGAVGFKRPDGATVALARMAGARDVALGVHGLRVRDDATDLREATLLATAADVGDACAFAAALINRDGIDRAGLRNLPITAGAVVAGGWLASRLRAAD